MKFENKTNVKNKKKIKKIIALISLIFVIFIFFSSANEIFSLFKGEKTEKIVLIPEKSSVDKISKILKEENIISNRLIFKIYSKFKDYKNYKSGKFQLKTNMKYSDLVETLCDQSKVLIEEKIIFTEGMNFFSFKEISDENSRFSNEEIIDALNDEKIFSLFSFFKKIKKEEMENAYFKMEGFVFPYAFPIGENSTPSSIAKDIFKKTDEEIKDLSDMIEKSKMSLWEIITLASIIQAETGDENEMKDVSCVFHNRLKMNKRLEADVTTLYSKKIENDMKQKGLKPDPNKIKSYDTYKVKGLPPGPICTPGRKAIEAAINPSKKDYLFFYCDDKTNKIFYEKEFEKHKKNYRNN